MSERALVKNAADPEQVKRARRTERDREARFTRAVQLTLAQPAGRLVFAELLERAGLYGSVFDHSGSMMYFKEGRRNFAIEMRAALEAADDAAVELMDQEMRARKRAGDREIDAAHTAAATEATG
jgi:hypothetical protein